jgi:uncharacterized protein YlzI (FlbEa/FlbD family)
MKSRQGIRMAWIKVTDPQGHPIYVSPEQVVRIRPCIAGAGDPASAKSVVDLVNGTQAVRETQDEIIERIKNAGKDEDKAAGA